MLGNSDIHSPDLRVKSEPDDHRSMTLIFAKDRTAASVKEALFEKRTAVWCEDQIIGREEILAPLFAASVKVCPVHHKNGASVYFQIKNCSNVDIQLERTGKLGPVILNLPAKATTLVRCVVRDAKAPYELKYTAKNFLIAPKEGLPVTLTVPAK